MIVAALVPMILCAGMAFGQTAKLDDLFNKLKAADAQAAERIEQEIWIEWSKSGSAAMDLLLERGRRAMSDGQLDLAVEHFTALVDHAPDFAEGWNARATAPRATRAAVSRALARSRIGRASSNPYFCMPTRSA